MHPRIAELLGYIDTQREALRSAVESVPFERRREVPEEGGWSVTQVLEHLAIVERMITRVFNDRVADARAAGVGEETESTSVLDGFPMTAVLDRNRRVESSERSRPKFNMDPETAWQAVETARHSFRNAIESADGLALATITHPNPVFGPMSLYGWIAFAGAHEARHAAQIRDIGRRLAHQPAPAGG